MFKSRWFRIAAIGAVGMITPVLFAARPVVMKKSTPAAPAKLAAVKTTAVKTTTAAPHVTAAKPLTASKHATAVKHLSTVKSAKSTKSAHKLTATRHVTTKTVHQAAKTKTAARPLVAHPAVRTARTTRLATKAPIVHKTTAVRTISR